MEPSMWKIACSPANLADRDLAAISLQVPENLQSENQLGLLLALWCGRVREKITVSGKVASFSYGFHAGEILVEPRGAYIRNEDRLKKEASRERIAHTKTDQTDKGASLQGEAGVDAGRWLPFGKISLSAGGQLKRAASKTEQINGEYFQIYWRLADSTDRSWQVFGIGLNTDGVLEYKIIGDEPLCFVSPLSGSREIEVTITYQCDLRDLWFEKEWAAGEVTDMRFRPEDSDRNRAVVASRIVARALNRRSFERAAGVSKDIVVLARQHLQASKEAKI